MPWATSRWSPKKISSEASTCAGGSLYCSYNCSLCSGCSYNTSFCGVPDLHLLVFTYKSYALARNLVCGRTTNKQKSRKTGSQRSPNINLIILPDLAVWVSLGSQRSPNINLIILTDLAVWVSLGLLRRSESSRRRHSVRADDILCGSLY